MQFHLQSSFVVWQGQNFQHLKHFSVAAENPPSPKPLYNTRGDFLCLSSPSLPSFLEKQFAKLNSFRMLQKTHFIQWATTDGKLLLEIFKPRPLSARDVFDKRTYLKCPIIPHSPLFKFYKWQSGIVCKAGLIMLNWPAALSLKAVCIFNPQETFIICALPKCVSL